MYNSPDDDEDNGRAQGRSLINFMKDQTEPAARETLLGGLILRDGLVHRSQPLDSTNVLPNDMMGFLMTRIA